MRTVIVSDYGVRLRASGQMMIVEARDRKLKVPVSEVDQVIVATGAVSITSSLVRLLARHGVELVFLSGRGEPLAMLYTPHYTRTPTTRREQYEAMMDRRAAGIAAEMAWCKVWNQALHLERRAVENHEPRLRAAAESIRARASRLRGLEPIRGYASEIMGAEAKAARIYWSSIALLMPGELGFDGRDPDSPDPVNSSLNYGYAILYSAVFRELVLAGLDPYAGFLHRDRSGRPVLVYDYSEMFKPGVVDHVVVGMILGGWRPRIRDGLLVKEDRSRLAKAIASRMKARVRSTADREAMSYADALRIYAYRLAKALRGHTAYRGFAERR